MLAQTLAAQVRQRKSVRSYDGQPLREADRAQLEAFIQQIENPYGIPVRFSLLDPAAHGLTSPVLTGARLYVAATVDKVPHGEEPSASPSNDWCFSPNLWGSARSGSAGPWTAPPLKRPWA